MKTALFNLLSVCSFLVGLLAAPALRAEDAGPVSVRVAGLESGSGSVRIEVYDSVRAYQEKRPLHRARVPVEQNGAQWISPPLPRGEYAFRVYHDEDDDGVLGRTGIGIPREPLGFSNNPVMRFGPPDFSDARFIHDGMPAEIEIRPIRAAKTRAPWSLGVGALYRQSPYLGGDDDLRVIPMASYVGERLFVLGPQAGFHLGEWRSLALSARARVAFGYDEEDSPALEGLGDRETTLEAGLQLAWRHEELVEVELGVYSDVLDRHGGPSATIEVSRGIGFEGWRLSPFVKAAWQSADRTDYYYGVPSDKAGPGRSAYRPGDALTYSVGASVFIRAFDPVSIFASVESEWFDSAITGSPLVGRDQAWGSLVGVVYRF